MEKTNLIHPASYRWHVNGISARSFTLTDHLDNPGVLHFKSSFSGSATYRTEDKTIHFQEKGILQNPIDISVGGASTALLHFSFFGNSSLRFGASTFLLKFNLFKRKVSLSAPDGSKVVILAQPRLESMGRGSVVVLADADEQADLLAPAALYFQHLFSRRLVVALYFSFLLVPILYLAKLFFGA